MAAPAADTWMRPECRRRAVLRSPFPTSRQPCLRRGSRRSAVLSLRCLRHRGGLELIHRARCRCRLDASHLSRSGVHEPTSSHIRHGRDVVGGTKQPNERPKQPSAPTSSQIHQGTAYLGLELLGMLGSVGAFVFGALECAVFAMHGLSAALAVLYLSPAVLFAVLPAGLILFDRLQPLRDSDQAPQPVSRKAESLAVIARGRG
jgi:hypothetical protein